MPSEYARDLVFLAGEQVGQARGSTYREALEAAQRDWPSSPIRIQDVWAEQSYRRVTTDEGAYDSPCGWCLLAYGTVQDGSRKLYSYCGPDGSLPLPMPQDAAEALAARVLATGTITPRYWVWISSDRPGDLPDYVLHPERYN